MSLAELMRLSLERQQAPADQIDQTIAKALARLEPGSSYTFRYSSPSARMIEVRRRRLASGAVVETVREALVASDGNDLNAQFAHIAEAARVRMMHALDVMADGFALYDAQDRLVVYNRKYVDLNSKVADFILPGIQFEDMLREAIRRGAYVLNGMPAETYFAQRLYRHRNPSEPYEVQLSDGRWILVNEKRTADGGIVKIRSDITEMKHREFDLLRISQQLHAKNMQFDSALNNMIQGVCMFDSEQRLIVCNRRYLEMYGFSPDVVKTGVTLPEIMRYSISLGNYTDEEASRALAERRDPTALKQRVTIKQRLRDGRIIAVMNEPMANGGTIATYQDITETERHAQQMQEYTTKLERSNRELQDFAYVASHDLQEPLRKIEAFGDRLVKKYAKELPDEAQMFVDRMQNAAGRMRRLINDLLAYSRVVSKANPFTKVNLNEVMTGVLSDLQIRIDEAGATIKVADLPEIEGDTTQMRQLLQNFLANAVKFRKPDVPPVVEVGAQLAASSEAYGDDEPRVVITITDNGIGFDNAYKDQIFKIFHRLHGRLEYEGTGIGLATCRKIVERHRGLVEADGRPGEGATFTITLPVKQTKLE
jgi:signal transduction histidine kinase